jgi:hypothetical protein
MGTSQSNMSKMSTVNDIINKNITNVVNNTINTTNQNCSGTQDLNVVFGPNSVTNPGCPVNVYQTMTIDCKTQSYFQQQNDQTLKSQVNTALENSLNSQQSAESASLTLVPYNQQSQSNIQEINNYIKNIVEKNLTSDVTNQCLTIARGAQGGKFEFNGICNAPINFTQDMLIKQYTDCIASSVNKILTDDTNIQKLANTTTSEQKIKVNSWGAIIAIIVVAIVFIALFYFGVKAFQSSPQGSTLKMMGATVTK